jgi:hypothetical protein
MISSKFDPVSVVLIRCLGVALFGNVVALASSSTACSAEATSQATSFTVEDPRAVAQTVLTLIERYGYVITYEDPPLVYAGDVQDLTAERHADMSYLKKPGAVREVVPMSETLTIKLPPPGSINNPQSMSALLEQVVQAHNANSHGGHLRLQQTEGVFHVVPFESKGPSGQWVSRGSLLDVSITLPESERSGAEMLDTICRAVSNATGAHVVVGHIPLNIVASYRGILVANDEPARSVLLRALSGTHRRLTWMLDYDAGAQRYYLSIVPVPNRATPPAPPPVSPAATSPSNSSVGDVGSPDPGR